MKLYDTLLDNVFWQRVRSDPAYADALSHIRAEFEEQAKAPLTVLPFSLRDRFYTDGDRSQFEKYYFGRRVLLSSAAILALVYPEKAAYLQKVEDTLWAICDEYSWALPAHCTGDYADDTTMVDLFVAETGAAVAEITAMLRERLHPRVFARARVELKRRVFDNYRDRRFGWETVRTNWSAVCAGGIGIAMMYAAPELMEEFLPRLLASEQCCMDSYTEDGACLEGMSYWAYGFGYFVYFADLLRRFTDGRVDIFADPKVKLMATFPQRNLMMGNTATSFADGDMHAKVPLDLYHFLHRRYPDAVTLPPPERMAFNEGNCRWVQFLRHFAYFDPALCGGELPKATYYLPVAGQYITTRETFSFAVKAGRNDEPHNHNDVGSFILSTAKGQELCDLGAGLYTRQYFGSERYTIFCNSSLRSQRADHKRAFAARGRGIRRQHTGGRRHLDIGDRRRLPRRCRQHHPHLCDREKMRAVDRCMDRQGKELHGTVCQRDRADRHGGGGAFCRLHAVFRSKGGDADGGGGTALYARLQKGCGRQNASAAGILCGLCRRSCHGAGHLHFRYVKEGRSIKGAAPAFLILSHE